MAKRRVYVVSGDKLVTAMFKEHQWEVVDSIQHADLVQFTGGSDVSPSLYGHTVHPTTGNNPIRDKKEGIIFNLCVAKNKPMAGICRGGQFLNVMCGGKMWQDVDNHAGRRHEVRDVISGEIFMATSTHHQMMIRSKEAVLIGMACESTRREMHVNDKLIKTIPRAPVDEEILYYDTQRCLCFQPHPEFGALDLSRRYFDYIDEYLFHKAPWES